MSICQLLLESSENSPLIIQSEKSTIDLPALAPSESVVDATSTPGPQDTQMAPLMSPDTAVTTSIVPTLRRSDRLSMVPSKLVDFHVSLPGRRQDNISYIAALESTTAAPISYKAAKHHSDWKAAMDREIQSVLKNDTWMPVDRPDDHPVITTTTRWVYKIKPGHHGLDTQFPVKKKRFACFSKRCMA